MTGTTPALPLIDIAPYLPPGSLLESGAVASRLDYEGGDIDFQRAEIAQAIHAACRHVGFFYLRIDHYIYTNEIQEVLSLTREFFARPKEEKERIHLNSERGDGVRGYQRMDENVTLGKVDHHEGLDLYAPSPYRDRTPETTAQAGKMRSRLRPLEGQNQWPEQPKRLREVMESWVEKMKILGMAVMHAMADGLGMSEEEWVQWKACVDDSFWVMRLIGEPDYSQCYLIALGTVAGQHSLLERHSPYGIYPKLLVTSNRVRILIGVGYPPLSPGAEGISCGEHRDYGCLT